MTASGNDAHGAKKLLLPRLSKSALNDAMVQNQHLCMWPSFKKVMQSGPCWFRIKECMNHVEPPSKPGDVSRQSVTPRKCEMMYGILSIIWHRAPRTHGITHPPPMSISDTYTIHTRCLWRNKSFVGIVKTYGYKYTSGHTAYVPICSACMSF